MNKCGILKGSGKDICTLIPCMFSRDTLQTIHMKELSFTILHTKNVLTEDTYEFFNLREAKRKKMSCSNTRNKNECAKN